MPDIEPLYLTSSRLEVLAFGLEVRHEIHTCDRRPARVPQRPDDWRPSSAQTLHESPFYCDMSMLSAAERAHKDEIGGQLAAVRLARPGAFERL